MGAIDSLIRIIDFLLQGVLVLSALWYALCDFQGVKNWVQLARSSFERIVSDSKLIGPDSGPPKSRLGLIIPGTVLMMVLIGGSYAIGVIVNAVIFDLLQPEHEYLIKSVQNDYAIPDRWDWHLLAAPLSRIYDHVDRSQMIARTKSMCQEIAWANQKHEVMQSALDPIVKQLRIFRGALLASFLFLIATLVKLVIRVFKRKNCWPLLFYGAFGLIFYIVGVRDWADSEGEYHMLVQFGVQTASSPPSKITGSSLKGSSQTSPKDLPTESITSSSSTASSSWDDEVCKKIR